jgi:hypothetical protein
VWRVNQTRRRAVATALTPTVGCSMFIQSFSREHPLLPLDSLQALDWLNFFVAALLMGFGPFAAVYLADRGWTPADIGFVLTASGLAGLLTQVPAGELLDMMQAKRMLVGLGTVVVTLGAMILALRPDFPSVFSAAVLQGATAGILGPGVAAISLGLVGHAALAERLGRNQRFASIGGLASAGIMGVIGYFLSSGYIFIAAAALELPVLLALVGIRSADIHFGRSCGAPDYHSARPPRTSRAVLCKDRRLLIFAFCSNSRMLPCSRSLGKH